MNADCFTYSSEPYYMSRIFNLFGYSYNQLKKEKTKNKYSRQEIYKVQKNLKGSHGSNKKLELEDYLRNDLLDKYVNPYKSEYKLNNFHFIAGADEIKKSVTVGSIDIKVILPTNGFMGGDEYFAIECKRINKLKATKNYYINHGVNRFISRQYYPETSASVAWMLSFMECEKESQKESVSGLVSSFNKILRKDYSKNIVQDIGENEFNLELDYHIDVFNSIVSRSDQSELQIYHVFLDYYNFIDP